MKRSSVLFTFSLLLFTSSAAVGLPEDWEVDLAAQPPKVFALQRPRGETYELKAVLKRHGKPFEPAITNACIYWQTNGMENLYWSAPASVSNNVLRAYWLPEMDPGATTVRGYIGDHGHIYAAAFQFRFIASPGALPNELPLPQKVIDFKKVRVLNPPWSGDVDTNAVREIVRETVAGAARPLPPYLHELDFCDSYTNEAAEYYETAPVPGGNCSARRIGELVERNYDWTFDRAAEFVVRMSTGPDRFASVGVASCGTNLSEEVVTSGKPSRFFKCLPGMTLDGINANGVVAEINVCTTNGMERWNAEGTVHVLGAVRWALDHATNAQHAAEYLAANVKRPSRMNFHYMIADETATYIVENGTATPTNGVPVMTNHGLFPPVYGGGMERDAVLASGSITNAWWTNAYRTGADWVSDFESEAQMRAAQAVWNAPGKTKEDFRGVGAWWQTVHTSIYDITNHVLRVAVQETDDWYTFAVPGGGGVSPARVRSIASEVVAPVASQVSSLASSKRDKTDLAVPMRMNPEYLPISGGDFDWSSHRLEIFADIVQLYDAAEREAAEFYLDGGTLFWASPGISFGGYDAQTLYGWVIIYPPDTLALASQVPTFEEKAAWDAKYAKPAGGIPASDLAPGVIPAPYEPSATDPVFSNAVANVPNVRTLNLGYQRLYSFSTGATNANISVTNYPPTAAEAEGRTHYDPHDPDLDFSTVPASMRIDETRAGEKRTVVDTRDWPVWYFGCKLPRILAAAQEYAHAAYTNALAHLSAWADRTARGLENPAGESTLVIDVPNIWLMTDQTFEKHVSGANSCWVIRSKNAAISPNVTTNGLLELTDAFGTPYIRFNKTEATFADPPATGIYHDDDAGEWVITYETATRPRGGANLALAGSPDYPGKAILKAEDDELCPAVITWTGASGHWLMHAKPKPIAGADPDRMFFGAVIEVEGQDYIEYLKPVSFSHIVMPNGKKIAPDVPAGASVGDTVSWKVVQ